MSEQEWNDYINEMFNLDKKEQKKEQKPIAADKGTQVHDAIERYLQGEKLTMEIIFSQQIGVFELNLN